MAKLPKGLVEKVEAPLRRINHTELPKAALDGISQRQQSYIDEFEFFVDENSDILSFYDGERMGVFYNETAKWSR